MFHLSQRLLITVWLCCSWKRWRKKIVAMRRSKLIQIFQMLRQDVWPLTFNLWSLQSRIFCHNSSLLCQIFSWCIVLWRMKRISEASLSSFGWSEGVESVLDQYLSGPNPLTDCERERRHMLLHFSASSRCFHHGPIQNTNSNQRFLSTLDWNLNGSKLPAGVSNGFISAAGTDRRIQNILNLFKKKDKKKERPPGIGCVLNEAAAFNSSIYSYTPHHLRAVSL